MHGLACSQAFLPHGLGPYLTTLRQKPCTMYIYISLKWQQAGYSGCQNWPLWPACATQPAGTLFPEYFVIYLRALDIRRWRCQRSTSRRFRPCALPDTRRQVWLQASLKSRALVRAQDASSGMGRLAAAARIMSKALPPGADNCC